MNRVRWSFEVVLIVIAMGLSASSYAQDPLESPTPEPVIPSASPPPNPLLTQRAEEIAKHAMRVLNEEEGVITLSLDAGHALANKTQILFFRRKGSRMEVISNGTVTGEQKNKQGGGEIVVDLDRDTIIKYPVKGDYAIPMADPNATAAGDKKDEFNYLVPEEPVVKVENDRPGYIEFGMGLLQGNLNTTSSTFADAFKKTSGYRFKNTHFAYFLDFFPIGIELDSHGGNFPTGTYYQKNVISKESVSTMALSYRLHPLFNKHLMPILKITSLSDEFTTDNTDENLLSTKISGTGFGARLNFDFASPVWKPVKSKFGFVFQNVFGEFSYFPSITASDVGVSRGTTSEGSGGMLYRLGFTSLIYAGFIPIVKRFVFQGSYGARSYNLKFQGSTVSEAGNPNVIPPNGTAKVQESDIRFFFGIRFEDPIKLLTQSPEKDKKKGEK